MSFIPEAVFQVTTFFTIGIKLLQIFSLMDLRSYDHFSFHCFISSVSKRAGMLLLLSSSHLLPWSEFLRRLTSPLVLPWLLEASVGAGTWENTLMVIEVFL